MERDEREGERERDGQTCRHADKHTEKKRDRLTDRQTDRQTDIDKETDRQTENGINAVQNQNEDCLMKFVRCNSPFERRLKVKKPNFNFPNFPNKGLILPT